MTKEIQEFNEFMIKCADDHTVFEGDSLTQFMQQFVELYEKAWGLNSQNETHVKVSPWYSTSLLMRYVREMIRRRGGIVNMHKAYGRDAYWFEVPANKKPPVIQIKNDPRKQFPDSAIRNTRIMRTIRDECKGMYVNIVFNGPDEFTVQIVSNIDDCKKQIPVH